MSDAESDARNAITRSASMGANPLSHRVRTVGVKVDHMNVGRIRGQQQGGGLPDSVTSADNNDPTGRSHATRSAQVDSATWTELLGTPGLSMQLSMGPAQRTISGPGVSLIDTCWR